MSITKNHLKRLKSLTQKKYRDENQQFLVEGIRLAEEAIDSDFELVEAVYTKELEEHVAGPNLLQKVRTKTSEVSEISDTELNSLTDTVTSQGIAVVLRRKMFDPEVMFQPNGAASVLVAFDSVADPGNAGTMIRTCDWFGVDGILMGNNSVELYNPKVVRSTAGGVFHLPIAENVDLRTAVTKCKELGYRVYVTDLQGETHFDKVTYEQKSLIIFGNEAWGVSDQLKDLADVRVLIRRYGAVESLNVSVACGVVLSNLHKLF
jgi:TrmH family RNA methyltransferase